MHDQSLVSRRTGNFRRIDAAAHRLHESMSAGMQSFLERRSDPDEPLGCPRPQFAELDAPSQPLPAVGEKYSDCWTAVAVLDFRTDCLAALDVDSRRERGGPSGRRAGGPPPPVGPRASPGTAACHPHQDRHPPTRGCRRYRERRRTGRTRRSSPAGAAPLAEPRRAGDRGRLGSL
jgi:hypothetical protein